jgi:hypothetical protein
MTKKECKTGKCEMVRDDKSIYHPDWKSASGKGDQPRNTTKAYEENYESIFPNAFKPKWQLETEEQDDIDAEKNS